jgi:hypothetical protein
LLAGRAFPIWVYAVRKDGFDGDIEITLDGAPARQGGQAGLPATAGFTLSGGTIPHGRDSVRMTLTATAPRKLNEGTTALHLVGRARIDGATVTRPAVPADNLMQAFAYWHLVPAEELLATVTGNAWPVFTLPNAGAVVKIPAGGEVQVQINCPAGVANANTGFELIEPPKGLSLGETAVVKGGLKLTLKADAAGEKPGYADNLIVGAYALQSASSPQAGAPAIRKRGQSYGNLPAIPIQIVPPAN